MSLGRSGPLRRNEPLRSDPARAREWQERSRKPMERRPMVTTSSRRKRQDHSDMAKARPIVRARSGGVCELRIPGVCEGRATNMHHRLEESQGGPSDPYNLIDVCGFGNASGCHGWVHQHPESTEDEPGSYELGWLVRMGQDPRDVPWGRAKGAT